MCLIFYYWGGLGNQNTFLWMTRTYLLDIVNSMAAVDLATLGARASAAKILNNLTGTFWSQHYRGSYICWNFAEKHFLGGVTDGNSSLVRVQYKASRWTYYWYQTNNWTTDYQDLQYHIASVCHNELTYLICNKLFFIYSWGVYKTWHHSYQMSSSNINQLVYKFCKIYKNNKQYFSNQPLPVWVYNITLNIT